jgi:hypothetical protein
VKAFYAHLIVRDDIASNFDFPWSRRHNVFYSASNNQCGLIADLVRENGEFKSQLCRETGFVICTVCTYRSLRYTYYGLLS